MNRRVVAASVALITCLAQCAEAAAGMDDETARLAASLRAEWRLHAYTSAAQMPPSIVSGKMLKASVDVAKAPATPQVQLTLDAGTVGVAYITTSLISPSGQHYATSTTFLPAYPAEPQTETVGYEVSPAASAGSFAPGIGLYAEPGVWRLSSITLIGNDGSLTTYDSGRLAALFPSTAVTVVNKSADLTPPTSGTGSILTPRVVLSGSSPYFAVKLALADDRSGVSSVAVAFAGPPGSNAYLGAKSVLTLPVKSGTVTAYAKLPLATITGIYTIVSLSVCDAAANCLTKTSPVDMATTFGTTTFEVSE